MKKLLHVAASPRIERSHSRKLATAFINRFLQTHPDFKLETLEAATGQLPSFGAAGATAKFKSGTDIPLTLDEAKEWNAARALFDQFAAADVLVISTPMWNFSLPYHLKNYVDLVTQVGWSIGYDNGYKPLMGNKKTAIFSASGSTYEGDAAAYDHLHSYLKFWAALIGLDAQFVTAAGVNLDIRDASIAKATQSALALADTL